MVIEIESGDDDERIEGHARMIADIVQAQTLCSDRATDDLRNALAEFAQEIKRQAIEP
jgi:hypothetical protein